MLLWPSVCNETSCRWHSLQRQQKVRASPVHHEDTAGRFLTRFPSGRNRLLEPNTACSAPLGRKNPAYRPATEEPRTCGGSSGERPREARQRLVGATPLGPEAASHEERRHRASPRPRGAPADALGPPAVGETDDEHPRVTRGLENAFLARRHEHRLGDDSDDLLNEKRRSRQEPTGVAPSERGVGLGSEEPERRPERPGEPSGDLDRGPVVLDAGERRHDRPARCPPRPPARRRHRASLEDESRSWSGRPLSRSAGRRDEERDRRRARTRVARRRFPARTSCTRRRGPTRRAR